MARRRFFVPAIHDNTAELRGDDARHLARVLRAEAGQLYEISDNSAAWLAEIVETRGDRVVFRALEPLPPVVLPLAITLCAALVKFDRFEWMVEKATELGVGRILPVEAARTEKGLREAVRKRAERWTRVARESSEQSRRVQIPEILPAVSFKDALALAADLRWLMDESQAPPLLQLLPERRVPATAALLIGPEGGWTDAERQAAAAAGWQPASLGPLIVRAETAAASAVAILVNAWMV
jgi:16S rRNA (uracil1498-N3)-methyltransferase